MWLPSHLSERLMYKEHVLNVGIFDWEENRSTRRKIFGALGKSTARTTTQMKPSTPYLV